MHNQELEEDRESKADLVDSDGFAVQLDHVHDLDSVVCVLLPEELNEPVALVRLGDAVLWHVHIDCVAATTYKACFFHFYFKYDTPQTGYNLVTLGTVYNHPVIQVNRLSQVLTHRDKLWSA